MKVVISTPTGNIGRVLTAHLLDGGAEVVLTVRDPGKVQDAVRRGAIALQGDLDDPDFLVEATRGADCLFWLTPSDYAAEDHRAHQLSLGRNAVAAVKANATPRVVHLSSLGAHQEAGTGAILGLREIEQRLDEVVDDVTHLRPGAFMENLLEALEGIKTAKSLFLPIAGDAKVHWIATRDIGRFAATRILDRGWSGRNVAELSGEVLSHDEIAATLSDEMGETIRHVQITEAQAMEALTGMGMSESSSRDLIEIHAAMGAGLLEPARPIPADQKMETTLRNFAREVIVPLAKGGAPIS